MERFEKASIVKGIVENFFEENSKYTGLDNMNTEDKQHVIQIGTSILCTKWEIGYQGGGFVQSVVDNDLNGAISKADGTSMRALKFFCQLMYNVGQPVFTDTIKN
jgi:hypothetical protein